MTLSGCDQRAHCFSLNFQVAINVPIFRDTATQDPTVTEAEILASGESAAKPWHIYMDAMGFGMGLSCLQLNFQVYLIFNGLNTLIK